MIIELKPEDERLVQKQLESGAFASVECVIHRALESLDADESWLQENKDAIHEQVGIGLAQLDRGEGLSADDSRAQLQARKAVWLRQRERE
jgi:antitoxin ParD1/3/4